MLGVIYNSAKMLKIIIWQLAIKMTVECRSPSVRLRGTAIVLVLFLFLHFGVMPENNIYFCESVHDSVFVTKSLLN